MKTFLPETTPAAKSQAWNLERSEILSLGFSIQADIGASNRTY
jgi:hypothetical protein